MDVAALLQTSESFLLHLEQVYTRDRVSQILQAPAPASSSICYHSRPYSLFSWNTGFLVIPWIFKLVPTSGPLHWKPPPHQLSSDLCMTFPHYFGPDQMIRS